MLKHRYVTGDRVLVMPGSDNPNVRAGIYTIVKALPLAGRGLQYRAKNATDTHERVLDEALLQAANA
jgi:hypothetical protein